MDKPTRTQQFSGKIMEYEPCVFVRSLFFHLIPPNLSHGYMSRQKDI